METKETSELISNGVSKGGARIVLDDEDDEFLKPTDLSEMLAEGTKESHDRAENCAFVKDFLRGRIKKELFKRGTAALYFVYSAMEEEIERNKDHPFIAPIYFPTELHRREALARDLEYFYGEDWESQVSLSAGTKPYVDRIHEVGAQDPGLLVAHSYTRYMGDLSGGQILKKVAQRALKLPSTGEGLNFYQFEGIHSHKGFKQLYRSRMNELEMDADAKQRTVDESNRAFGFNMMVFTELEEIGKTIKDEVQEAGLGHSHAEIMEGGDINKCPYYAAKMAASGNPTYACQLAVMLLKHPPCQVALAAWVAILAGFTAWYLF
ncbi:heme oxygenase 2a [Cheilinus undulatus]|uniref:heme oxygenase 2a n=1 Tax=Cheilinus undulatus TaxID=241271 RepID=UPI001BD57BC9|nr:heme oxygenase 2a [Cheilinus undulatus]XP_041640317.1 heme oxygenase 2a [Cheilinus undulatus]XP_041640318.1 heme oxygenase 2a [Cheilinus undulatus]